MVPFLSCVCKGIWKLKSIIWGFLMLIDIRKSRQENLVDHKIFLSQKEQKKDMIMT